MMRREDIVRLFSGTGETIEVRGQFRGRLFLQDFRALTLPSFLRRKRGWALAMRRGARVQWING
jgi:hypothetical protein